MSFHSLIKGITPKIRMLWFVLINSVLLNLLCQCLVLGSCFRTLAASLSVSDFFLFFLKTLLNSQRSYLIAIHSLWFYWPTSDVNGLGWRNWQRRDLTLSLDTLVSQTVCSQSLHSYKIVSYIYIYILCFYPRSVVKNKPPRKASAENLGTFMPACCFS